ncbi:MAG: hypothetical protein Q8M03_03240 [Legionella sp.]|nr:hypothetical protein [Legionella sp.]
MTSLKSTLDHFNAYLVGGSSRALALYMKYYDNRLFALNRDFHLITIDDDEIKLEIECLLRNLMIPEGELGRYFESGFTVYQLLQELTKEKYIQAHYMLQLIDKKTQLRTWDLILGGLLSATMLAGLLSTPIFSGVVALIEGFLASARTLPIVGLFFNTGVAIYNLYKNQLDKKRPLFNRIRDNFFVVAGQVLNCVGYGIWIITGSAMTPLIAGLFVAVSGLDVIKEVFGLVQEFIQHKRKNLLFDEEPLNINRTYARYDYSFKKYRNAIIINLVAAVALVGIMAAWCFMPGGIFVAIAATVAIVGVYAVKILLLKKNDEIIRERLQTELRRIDRVYQVSQSAEMGETPASGISLENERIEEESQYVQGSSLNFFPDKEENEDILSEEKSLSI